MWLVEPHKGGLYHRK